MDDKNILSHLEALARALDIEIRYEAMADETMFRSGGLCRLRDRQFIIVNREASVQEKVRILAKAMRRFDLRSVYLKPALRDLLEGPADD